MEKPTVLCVDAELSTLARHEALLKNHGCNVLVTTSGRQSLELLASLPIDAVILDLELPGMNRGLLANRMKQLRPHVPIMLVCPDDRLPEHLPECVDAFWSEGESADKFVAAVHDLVATRSSFFDRWLWDWKQRLTA